MPVKPEAESPCSEAARGHEAAPRPRGCPDHHQRDSHDCSEAGEVKFPVLICSNGARKHREMRMIDLIYKCKKRSVGYCWPRDCLNFFSS